METKETYIVYFDEAGDDGITSSSCDHFVLTSLYMPANKWQQNFDIIKNFRKQLKSNYGLHVSEEMHTKHFLCDKDPYRKYSWTQKDKIDILTSFTKAIGAMDIKIVNIVIDKNNIYNSKYEVLKNALTYNIQRIENDSKQNWNYIILTDQGRVSPMRKTARAIRAYNPIQSHYEGYINQPIKGLIEDILEKDSRESFFIQLCDFISYFVHLYFVVNIQHKSMPNRVARLIPSNFPQRVLATLKKDGVLNIKANSSSNNPYGIVIYPKKR